MLTFTCPKIILNQKPYLGSKHDPFGFHGSGRGGGVLPSATERFPNKLQIAFKDNFLPLFWGGNAEWEAEICRVMCYTRDIFTVHINCYRRFGGSVGFELLPKGPPGPEFLVQFQAGAVHSWESEAAADAPAVYKTKNIINK